MTYYGSQDGRIVIGPAEIGNEIFARYDQHCKDWRWHLRAIGIEVDSWGNKRSSRTGELI